LKSQIEQKWSLENPIVRDLGGPYGNQPYPNQNKIEIKDIKIKSKRKMKMKE
jgi:hypothetical protein